MTKEELKKIFQKDFYPNKDYIKQYKITEFEDIIDKIDDYICPLYGLTQEEMDFIKNYELEFRLAGE